MSEYSDTIAGMDQARVAVNAAYIAEDPTEASWLTYRLLWALPWSASSAPRGAIAAVALGAVFDATVLSRHACRPFADAWVVWSSKWTSRFGAIWAALLKNHPDDEDDL